jgi:hypothetical protein
MTKDTTYTTKCRHKFHYQCLHHWCEKLDKKTCPYCRGTVDLAEESDPGNEKDLYFLNNRQYDWNKKDKTWRVYVPFSESPTSEYVFSYDYRKSPDVVLPPAKRLGMTDSDFIDAFNRRVERLVHVREDEDREIVNAYCSCPLRCRKGVYLLLKHCDDIGETWDSVRDIATANCDYIMHGRYGLISKECHGRLFYECEDCEHEYEYKDLKNPVETCCPECEEERNRQAALHAYKTGMVAYKALCRTNSERVPAEAARLTRLAARALSDEIRRRIGTTSYRLAARVIQHWFARHFNRRVEDPMKRIELRERYGMMHKFIPLIYCWNKRQEDMPNHRQFVWKNTICSCCERGCFHLENACWAAAHGSLLGREMGWLRTAIGLVCPRCADQFSECRGCESYERCGVDETGESRCLDCHVKNANVEAYIKKHNGGTVNARYGSRRFFYDDNSVKLDDLRRFAGHLPGGRWPYGWIAVICENRHCDNMAFVRTERGRDIDYTCPQCDEEERSMVVRWVNANGGFENGCGDQFDYPNEFEIDVLRRHTPENRYWVEMQCDECSYCELFLSDEDTMHVAHDNGWDQPENQGNWVCPDCRNLNYRWCDVCGLHALDNEDYWDEWGVDSSEVLPSIDGKYGDICKRCAEERLGKPTVRIQAFVRGCLLRGWMVKVKRMVVFMQAFLRGCLARKRLARAARKRRLREHCERLERKRQRRDAPANSSSTPLPTLRIRIPRKAYEIHNKRE